jgi:hypothetical protein
MWIPRERQSVTYLNRCTWWGDTVCSNKMLHVKGCIFIFFLQITMTKKAMHSVERNAFYRANVVRPILKKTNLSPSGDCGIHHHVKCQVSNPNCAWVITSLQKFMSQNTGKMQTANVRIGKTRSAVWTATFRICVNQRKNTLPSWSANRLGSLRFAPCRHPPAWPVRDAVPMFPVSQLPVRVLFRGSRNL